MTSTFSIPTLGLTDPERRTLHRVACGMYQQGRFDDAEKFFGVLCLDDHEDWTSWLGLGACRQQRGNYAAAIPAYGVAHVASGGDPWTSLHAAECLLFLGKVGEADHALESSELFSELADDGEHLRERIAALRYVVSRLESDPTLN
jgi:tetratricopeptide (TPR) repeat protein